MTRMRDIQWPQPTWALSLRSKPCRLHHFKDEKGLPQIIVLNRGNRRRLTRQNTTHLERLMSQETMHDHVRHLVRRGPTPKQARGRRARARAKAARLADRILEQL